MRRRWWKQGGMKRIWHGLRNNGGPPSGGGSIMVKFPLAPFVTCLLHLQILLEGHFHPKKKAKQPQHRDTQWPNIMNLFIEEYMCSTLIWICWCLLRHQITCHSPPCPVSQNSATTVARTSEESPACLNTCLWSMELAVPQKYCQTDAWPSCGHAEGSASPSAASPSRQGSALRSSSAGTWTFRCQGQVCQGIHIVAGWDQCDKCSAASQVLEITEPFKF